MSRYDTNEKEEFYYTTLEALNNGVAPQDLFEVLLDAIGDFRKQEEIRES